MEKKYPVRLVAADMDGTLLNSKKDVSPRFFKVLEHMNKSGIRFAAATGRQYFDICAHFPGYAESILIAGSNGTLVTDGKKIIHTEPADREAILGAVEVVRKLRGACPFLCGVTHMFADSATDAIYEKGCVYRPGVEELTNLADAYKIEEILKLSVVFYYDEVMDEAIELLRPYGDVLDMHRSGTDWLECQKKGTGKDKAMDILQDYVGVTPEETAIFGDYLNDLPMMSRAHYSFCMKNGHPDVKAAARFVTEYTNDEDGVTEALIGLLGLEERGI